MTTDRTKVRPRNRNTNSPLRQQPSPAELPRESVTTDEQRGVPLLARLPEVSAPSDRGPLSKGVDWLNKLDWQRIRRMNLDPNWVAGGVLALVLFLLLVITLNRSPKPPADTTVQSDAPTWSTAQNPAPVATPAAVANDNAAGASGSIPANSTNATVAAGTSASSTLNPAASSQSSGPAQPAVAVGSTSQFQPSQASLEGIYYPRTPYAAPVGMASHSSQPEGAAQTAGQSALGDGIRTAQRDVPATYRPPVPPGQPSGRAHFEGTISQP